ncbi:uncharacterized protein LOC126638593 [Myiozetetes cayanensis]|uniref:uncharacterized protein LOC126638593 n=1 Tax=Myiozetetes cayanensis TaxID=478635 RepID=UPI0021604277|nr:uncharacterized protein LOC126638593 [Myiozetetes cayanensis]
MIKDGGVSEVEKTIVNSLAIIEHIANQTLDAIIALQEEVNGLSHDLDGGMFRQATSLEESKGDLRRRTGLTAAVCLRKPRRRISSGEGSARKPTVSKAALALEKTSLCRQGQVGKSHPVQGYLPMESSAFEIRIWDDIGKELREEITKGSKELARYGPLWRALAETLKSMKTERQITASAFAALVGGETDKKEGGTESASQFLFAVPPIPLPVTAKAAPSKSKSSADASVGTNVQPASAKAVAPLKSSAGVSEGTSVTDAPVPRETASATKPSAKQREAVSAPKPSAEDAEGKAVPVTSVWRKQLEPEKVLPLPDRSPLRRSARRQQSKMEERGTRDSARRAASYSRSPSPHTPSSPSSDSDSDNGSEATKNKMQMKEVLRSLKEVEVSVAPLVAQRSRRRDDPPAPTLSLPKPVNAPTQTQTHLNTFLPLPPPLHFTRPERGRGGSGLQGGGSVNGLPLTSAGSLPAGGVRCRFRAVGTLCLRLAMVRCHLRAGALRLQGGICCLRAGTDRRQEGTGCR